MDKLHSYQGWGGRFNEWRDDVRVRYANWREEHPETIIELVKRIAREHAEPSSGQQEGDDDDFSHIYRTKSRMELIRISAAVMGIEFSYAAETAFVSPTLLKIGVKHQHMTLVWALSPLIGFFLTPILGSISDRCRLDMGRRRPFIIMLSIGVFLGLLLVPNGEDLGYAFGDFNPHLNESNVTNVLAPVIAHRATASNSPDNEPYNQITPHPWGILFTILGTVMLDFDADACQSPARAYLLDVTVPEDHARGLSTFTIMAGLGGFMGYSLGGINWDATVIGVLLGGHIRAVFTLVTFIFIICVAATVTSFREVPLHKLEAKPEQVPNFLNDDDDEEADGNQNTSNSPNSLNIPKIHSVHSVPEVLETDDTLDKMTKTTSYGALGQDQLEVPNIQKRRYTMPPLPTNSDYSSLPGQNVAETSFGDGADNKLPIGREEGVASLSHYLMSIVLMPHSLRMVCLTNLFCWMAHVCYSLYFTDFVGEAVFGGDPKAPEGSIEQVLYENGVRFGCWGMAMYSLSCACYSTIIEKLIKKFRAKKVYMGGLLFYCIGMSLMAMTRAKVSVIVFSWAAGVMYSTLFTMPYLLIAHYHDQGTFEVDASGEAKLGTEIRGLGTDVAIVSSMVFLAQFILSICMGSIVSWSGTTTAVVTVASFLSLCGAISASQIMYLDL